MRTTPLPRVWISALLFVLGGLLAHAAPQVIVREPTAFPPLGPDDTMLPGDHLPVLTKQVPVLYPAELAVRGEGDRVFVAFVVDQEGAVIRARAAFGNRPECESAAVEAVSQWAFTAGTHLGKKVRTQMMVEVRFVPDSSAAPAP